MDKNFFVRTAWSILGQDPWLKYRLQKHLWLFRAKQAMKERSQNLPSLLKRYSAIRKKNSEPKHIILIVLDSMRKQNLSLYGYHRDTTPFLNSMADRAVVFTNALTASPWTYPSVATILTGIYPHRHGGMHTNDMRNFDKEMPNEVDKDILSLPELLFYLGFDTYFGSEITTAALPCIGWFNKSRVALSDNNDHMKKILTRLKRNRKKDTFIYFHTMGLHPPINLPEPYMNSFGKIVDHPKLNTWDFQKDVVPGEPRFELYRRDRERLYDSTIRYIDAKLSTFIKCLEEDGIMDSSLVIITSDHGEELWDHVEIERRLFYDPRGFFGVGHGHNLFQELINVPLICMGSGLTGGCYNHNVSLVDLVPTILDFCGIEHELVLDGRNLFECSDERVLISEATAYGYEKKAVLCNNWKLIHSEGDGISLLFDLNQDPKEKHDLAKVNTEKVNKLKDNLPNARIKGEKLRISRNIKKQLRDLGYM